MDLDALREQLANWERIGVKGPVYEAARAVLDSEEAWECGVHSWPWPKPENFYRCMIGSGRGEDCELSAVRVVRVRLLAEEGT